MLLCQLPFWPVHHYGVWHILLKLQKFSHNDKDTASSTDKSRITVPPCQAVFSIFWKICSDKYWESLFASALFRYVYWHSHWMSFINTKQRYFEVHLIKWSQRNLLKWGWRRNLLNWSQRNPKPRKTKREQSEKERGREKGKKREINYTFWYGCVGKKDGHGSGKWDEIPNGSISWNEICNVRSNWNDMCEGSSNWSESHNERDSSMME